MSLQGGRRLSDRFEAALAGGAAGAVVVVAAGNDSAPDPAWPARYAEDPRFAGSMIGWWLWTALRLARQQKIARRTASTSGGA